MNKTPDLAFTKNSKVSIGLLIGLLVGVGSGAIEWGLEHAQIDQLKSSQWTVNDQLRWTSEMQKRNPDVDIPIPDVNLRETAGFRIRGFAYLTNTNTLNP